MKPSIRISVTALILGLAFDLTLNGQAPGIAVPLFVAAAAAGFRFTAPRSDELDRLLIGAAAFSMIAAIRNEAAVLGPAMLSVAGLFILAVTGSPHRMSVPALTATDAAERSIAVLRGAFRVPGFLAAPLRAAGSRTRGRGMQRATMLSVAVVAVFGALFASADRVFAETLVPQFHAAGFATHMALILAGTWMAGVMWTANATESLIVRAHRVRARLAPVEWTAALWALAGLFAAFVAIQFAFLFGGRGRVEVTPGLTYAAYARSGFFQLLTAGGLTIVVLLGAWDLGERTTPEHKRRFVVVASAITGLCLVVLASAALRLSLYQQAFGFTTSRLVAWIAIGATAVALAGLLAAIVFERRRNVFAGGIALVLSVVLTLAVVSPAAFVARRNVERYDATGRIDVPYLTLLGPEAVPELVALLPRLNQADRMLLLASLCTHAEDGTGDWRSWNFARERARRAVFTLDCPAGGPGADSTLRR